jgi:hypothetical protein
MLHQYHREALVHRDFAREIDKATTTSELMYVLPIHTVVLVKSASANMLEKITL